MKYAILIVALFALSGCKTVENLVPEKRPVMKLVEFDQFMNGQLSKSIPITFLIPEEYEHADIESPLTYSYWMKRESVQKVKDTGNMPLDSGWFYGKASMNVGYDMGSDKFIGTDNLEYQAKLSGFSNIKSERFNVSGFPVLILEMEHLQSGKTIYSMYIGMNLETNAAFLAYREPKGQKAVGRYVWSQIVSSIKSNL